MMTHCLYMLAIILSVLGNTAIISILTNHQGEQDDQ